MNKFIFLMLAFTCTLSANVFTISEECQLPNDNRELYIDLMKKCLANTIYGDKDMLPGSNGNYKPEYRENGRDWPVVAHTMIGMKRLDNIHYCMKNILENNIPGDVIEAGVWRGGATILMRAILKAYGDESRYVWVADSFEGFPPTNSNKYPEDKGLELNKYSELAVSLEQVQANFAKYGLLDKQVIFLKGFFCHTIPYAPIKSISLLRLDGDLYESTMDCLVNLYPKLSIGGYIIVDDYGAIPACAKAIQDYRKSHNIKDRMHQIDWTGVYWKKSQ
jgi:hypothetical protein